MKGVILAGGTGTRLYPCTKVTNKHLLPVFNKPMIYYPIETLKNSGIQDILIISSPEHAGDFMQLLGSGAEFDLNFTYRIQDGAGGIAQALSLAEPFAAGDSIAVILSDNIFEDTFTEAIFYFQKGANIFVKSAEDPARFGVVEMKEDGSVRSIEEKPAFPKSNLVQTGFYLYDNQVFDFIRQVQPSKRGELEITDVNNIYLEKSQLKATQFGGMWADAGTHESLLEANILAQEAFSPERVKRYKQQKSLHPTPSKETNQEASPKVTIGLLTHNSENYLAPCLNSLLSQEYENTEIIILDNQSEDETVQILQSDFPDIRLIENDENLGFARGHNKIIAQSEGEFYACVNIDMIFEPNFISELVKSISEKPIYGSSGGKLKQWDFKGFKAEKGIIREAGKTNFLDSAGIKAFKNHRFEDIGQGEVDYGQYDQSADIFGVSGAAVLYRRKALEDTAFTNKEGLKEYFDESMFMYKEDVDLAYRLQWAGWKCRFNPKSVAYHDRTVRASETNIWKIISNRSKKSSRVNQTSYLNHQILLRKNYTDDFSMAVKGATTWYNFKVFCYICLFETETLSQWFKLMKLQQKIKAQKKSMPKRVSQAEIEQLMEA